MRSLGSGRPSKPCLVITHSTRTFRPSALATSFAATSHGVVSCGAAWQLGQGDDLWGRSHWLRLSRNIASIVESCE